MRKVLNIVSILFLCLVLSNLAEANLLTNPGFETGDFTGWTTTSSYSIISEENPHAGSNYHVRINEYGDLRQSVNVTAGELYELSVWTFMSDGDAYGAGVFLDFYDENEQHLGGWMQTVEQLPRNQYNEVESYSLTAPESAVTAEVYGSLMASAYMDLDDFDFSPVPEPSSVILLGTGLLSIFSFGIRRKI